MNWNQLQYVLTIAQEKNITKAAQKLYLSQPSLSMSMKSLEQELGTTLFERKNGTLSLTYAGELFCHWATSTLRSQQILSDQLSDISTDARHKIRLGISPHRSLILLPDILTAFYEKSHNCDIQIIEEPTYLLKELLEEDQLDLIIDIPHPDTINYNSELLAREHILLAVPKQKTALFQKNLSPKQAVLLTSDLELPFILLTEKQILGQISQRIFEACAFHPQTTITCSNLETALTLAAQGLGATFVPDIYIRQKRFSDKITYYSLENYPDTRDVCLIYRKNQYLNRHLQLLLELFRERVPVLYPELKYS